MNTAAFVLALIAYANAGYVPHAPVPVPAANSAVGGFNNQGGAVANQAGFNTAGHGAHGAGAHFNGGQGGQGSQGSQGFGFAGEHADAQHSAGRYDHAASLLAASDRTSAAAEQAAAQHSAVAGFGNQAGAQGSQGAHALGAQAQNANGAEKQQAGQNYGAHGGHQQAASNNNNNNFAPFYGNWGWGNGFGGWGFGAPYGGGYGGAFNNRGGYGGWGYPGFIGGNNYHRGGYY